MPSSPSISVIIPTFNRAALLARCLASLRGAGIPDLEVIVVDDGGTDDTPAVVASFPGTVYIRQKNGGPAAARNLGFASSRGRYIGFIDSDDEWVEGGAQRLATQLDANVDVSVIFADAAMGNDTTGFVSFIGTYGATFFALPHEQRFGVRILARRPFFLQLSTRNVMFLGSMLFRREAFQDLQGFDRSLRGAADWELFMRTAATGNVAYSEGPALSRYYKHETAMSTDRDHMEEDFILALDAVRRRCELDDIERTHLDHRIREHVFGWAYGAYDVGDFRVARERLRLAQRLGQMGPRERAFLLATYLPKPVIRVLRRTKHALDM